MQAGGGQSGVAFWQENAAAVIARLESKYPLYRDIVQPLKRGILEASHGLSYLLEAAGTPTPATLHPLLQLAEIPCFKGMEQSGWFLFPEERCCIFWTPCQHSSQTSLWTSQALP